MNKEFCTYEQALALKKLGFDEPCLAYYNKKELFSFTQICNEPLKGHYIKMSNRLCAPFYSQAFRWFREKHNLYSEINLDSYKEPYSLKVTIKHLDDTNTFVDKEYYPYSNGIGDIDNKKYEEAEQFCLDKLIEICKNK
jgi:hypothetical protein